MPIAVGEFSLFREGAGGLKLVSPVKEDTQLIRKAQTGDMRAFNALVRAYQERAYRLAYRILGDREAAGDATQEAFISAYRHIGAFRGGSLHAWLMRIVTNACYDQMRKKQRRRTDSLDAMLQDREEVEPSLVHSGQETLQDHAERRELNELIQRGLQGLPFHQRVTLVLTDIEEYSYEKVAEITQTNIGTVKSRLARGRGSLREFLLAQEGLLPMKYRQATA